MKKSSQKNSTSILDSINSPSDLKKLNYSELNQLCGEIRKKIIDVVSKNGGHLAANLGVVELTVALHRLFSSPNDAIIFDVGHQCYTHKILTSRKDKIESIRLKNGISGFPRKTESPHDISDCGHASTSISLALGIATANRAIKNGCKAVAVIGDGALTGGMAFEALNHGGYLQEDLIVVLNDNDMSIDRNVGALSSRPRSSKVSYAISRFSILPCVVKLRKISAVILDQLPVGKSFFKMIQNRITKMIKALFLKENFFSQLGFSYVGPVDGHNIKELEKIFTRVKRLNKPVVVHVLTQKGKGYLPAEKNPSSFHGVGAFNIVDGKVDKKQLVSFTDCFSSILLSHAAKNDKIVAISAAMINGTGLSEFASLYPKRTFDVGIAEQHAVTFAAGLASRGLIPIVAIYSTFMQRCADQVIHDIALPNLPVIFVMSRSGYVADDGETHQGLFDISIFSAVPNLVLLSPSSSSDFALMFDFALSLKRPVLIRLPKDYCSENKVLSKPIKIGQGIFVHKNSLAKSKDTKNVLLISLGGTFNIVEEAYNELAAKNIGASHYNLRFAKPLNLKALHKEFARYSLIVIAQESCFAGSAAQEIAASIAENSELKNTAFRHFSAPDLFLPQATRGELFEIANCTSQKIVASVEAFIKKSK